MISSASSASRTNLKTEEKKADQKKQFLSKDFPRQYDLKKYPNGLLNKEQILAIFKILKDKPYGRYSKKLFLDVGAQFGIIKDEQGYFAIYNEENLDKTRKQVVLGEGGSGAVKLLCYLGDGVKVCDEKLFAALKTGRLSSLHDFSSEYKITKKLNTSTGSLIKRTETKIKSEKVEFLIDYHSGYDLFDLQNLIIENKLDEAILAKVILSVLENYYQKFWLNDLIHCDIKLENYMFNPSTEKGAFIDFGFSRECQRNKFCQSKLSQGTPGYAAPEIMTHLAYSHSSEVYALGSLFRHLLWTETYSEKSKSFEPCEEGCEPTSLAKDSEIEAFIAKMMSFNFINRPTFPEVLTFFKSKFENKNQIQKTNTSSQSELNSESKDSIQVIQKDSNVSNVSTLRQVGLFAANDEKPEDDEVLEAMKGLKLLFGSSGD